MDPKEVIFSPEAERAIKKLSKQDLKAVWGTLKKLRAGDDGLSIEKIKANPAFFRMKAGKWRIVFYPLSHGRVVLLLIGDRKNIYRNIPNLDQKLETALRKIKAV